MILLLFWVIWTCMSKKMLGASLAPPGKMCNTQNNIDPKGGKINIICSYPLNIIKYKEYLIITSTYRNNFF